MLPPVKADLDRMMADYGGERALVCGCQDPRLWWRLKNAFDTGQLLAPLPGMVSPRGQIHWMGACQPCADAAGHDPTRIKPRRYIELALKQAHQDAMFVPVSASPPAMTVDASVALLNEPLFCA